MEALCGGKLSPPLARCYSIGRQEMGVGELEVAVAPTSFLLERHCSLLTVHPTAKPWPD